MILKLLPVLLALLGLGLGVGAGVLLRPDAENPDASRHDDGNSGPAEAPTADNSHDESHPDATESEAGVAASEYVKLNNQFVVPLIADGRVTSMVILSLSLEVSPGATEATYAVEPRLRDALLQAMFDHANSGGFDGSFTDGRNLSALRRTLLEAARQVLGADLREVLISDIMRQDS